VLLTLVNQIVHMVALCSRGHFVPNAISGTDATDKNTSGRIATPRYKLHSNWHHGHLPKYSQREAALWTFVDIEGVEPTNNLAEREIRPGVLWRNSSFGTQSKAGSRFVERIMTVVTTLKQQGRNPLDYLTEACEAANRGRSAPSLLPTLSMLTG